MTTAQLTASSTEKARHGPDMDSSSALAEKRKQIDEEIARFKSLKEKEFREFEKDLLKQRQGRVPSDNGKALSLLGGAISQSWHHVNDHSQGEKANIKPAGVASKPTLRVDKLHVNGGSNLPPVTVTATVAANESSRSPSPLSLKRQCSHSTSKPTEALTCLALPVRPRCQQERDPREQTPTSLSSHNNHMPNHKNNKTHNTNHLAAILTPTYLPLLETYSGTTQMGPLSSNNVSITSNVSTSISSLSQHRRIKTEPIIPSHSLPLPSALRSPSGSSIRKHKHVTLQLADSVIVEPSSSYEEGPSPIVEGELHLESTAQGLGLNPDSSGEIGQDEGTSTGLLERRMTRLRRNITREPDDKKRKPRRKKGQLQDQQQDQPEQARVHQHVREEQNPMQLHGPGSPLAVSVEAENLGSSRVGFFELDEELASPARDLKFFLDDEDLNDRQPQHSGRFHRSEEGEDDREDRKDEASASSMEDLDADGPFSEKGIEKRGDNHPYVYSASVPIDIVKPSGSWLEGFRY